MNDNSACGSRGLSEFQIVLILVSIGFLVVYISRLRLVEGRLCRFLPSDNPLMSLMTLLFSLYLLNLIFRELEAPWFGEKYSRRDILDLFLLVMLMFPGTGLAAIILPRVGVPEWIPFAMRGWTYVFLPTVYVLMWKKEEWSSLGFRGRSLLLSDIIYAFSTAIIGVTAIDALNSLISKAINAPPEPQSLGIPSRSLFPFVILHATDMIQNVAWNGLIQNRIEGYFKWSSRGFWIFFIVISLLFNFYFEPRTSLDDFIRYAPSSTLGLLIDCYLFHKTKRIATPALWHWFANAFGMIPII